MTSLRLFLLPLTLSSAVLTVTVAAQPAPPDPATAYFLAAFVRDATTVTALPWQQETLGLSAAQVTELRWIADDYGPLVEDLFAELRMLFENVGMLDRPVDAHEAFALYYDVARHKAEALMTFHAAAEAMLAVLTPEQRAQWEAELEAAAREQQSPATEDAPPPDAPTDPTHDP